MVALRAVAAAAALALHPLHTTLTQVGYRAVDRTAQVSLRMFADDFAAAAGGVTDSAAFKYVRTVLTLTGRDGRVMPLAWCGLRRTGDLLWLCLEAAAPRGLAGVRVEARQLFERYRDQINIVQVTYNGHETSMLFVRGDAAKELP